MESLVGILRNEEGEINWRAFFIRTIILNIPNIIDLILTAISFEEEIKTYFILRFIAQSLNLLFCISAACFSSYENSDGIDGMPPCIFLFCCSIFILGLEIPSLVFFIKDFETIESLGKIGYYIHLSLIPCLFLNFSLNTIIDRKC